MVARASGLSRPTVYRGLAELDEPALDVGRNQGWVEVGIDQNTAAFAVAAIRAWWHGDGVPTYPTAKRLLITADAGFSGVVQNHINRFALAS